MDKTFNFRLEDYDHKVESFAEGEFVDERNGIICVNPSMDWECYMNYIDLLNFKRDYWKSYGYLDLGMMPLAMAPSFMQLEVKKLLTQCMKDLTVPVYNLPPVAVLHYGCKLAETDVWVFKEDLAKVIGMPKDKITLERFLKWVGVV